MALELIDGNLHHSTRRLADLIWTVDERLMTFLFGSPDDWHRLFSIDWRAHDGICNHNRSVVAEDGNEIKGVIIGYSADIVEQLFETTLTRWLKDETPAKGKHLEEAFNKMDRLFPHPMEGSFYILDLAVDVNARKLGIGRKLMDWAVSQAKQHGLSALELDVDADNPAVDFYRRLGMYVEVETLVPELSQYHGVERHYHMKLRID